MHSRINNKKIEYRKFKSRNLNHEERKEKEDIDGFTLCPTLARELNRYGVKRIRNPPSSYPCKVEADGWLYEEGPQRHQT